MNTEVAGDTDAAGNAVKVLPARDVVAIVLAGGGSLLVFISLLVDWQRIIVRGSTAVHVGIADIPTWGTVYIAGAMMLVAVFVCVVALPVSFGPTARVLGVSWSLGVAAIIVAMLVRMTGTPALPPEALSASTTTVVTTGWGPGIIYAALAVTALMGAFLVACPPLRQSTNLDRLPRQETRRYPAHEF